MPSIQNRLILGIGAVGGIAGGSALAYWKPDGPLLAFWLSFALVLGLWIALTGSLAGLRQRAQWLVALHAVVVFFALLTTQVAARRAISATHLRYEGVLLESVDRFTVGSGEEGVDVRLPVVMRDQVPWSVRIAKRDSSWTVEPLSGVEELRVGVVGSDRDYRVSRSAVLSDAGDAAAIVDASGAFVDTIRLASARELRTTLGLFSLTPVSALLEARYRKGLRFGVALSDLDGARRAPAAYERFVRVRELVPQSSALSLLPLRKQYLITASPPFGVRGARASDDAIPFSDSAAVEVRQGDARWRFVLRDWRRAPSANVGLALFFHRNPRPLDTPLPAGINCPVNAACGAISLRRFPPPVAHISLDEAGFDTERFGLLGIVARDDAGITVRLPSESYHVDKGGQRPVAVPVRLVGDTTGPRSGVHGAASYWVLLGASGAFGGELSTIVLIGSGLALLLLAVSVGVSSARFTPAGAGAPDERVLAVGLTTILGLLLTRLVIGARVAFFAPFLERGIETAVGMWVAVSLVILGLLAWPVWMPPLLAHARMLIGGRSSPAGVARRAAQALGTLPAAVRKSPSVGLALVGFALLALASPAAVLKGLLAGGMVLLAWITVAWVTAFAGSFFETFERGAWSVVEQLSPERDRSKGLASVPELWLILSCISAEAALKVPLVAAVIAGLALIGAANKAIVRARGKSESPTPDPWGAAVGAALFTLAIAVVAGTSENGSMAAFVLVVFVALASVRVGRAINARLRREAPTWERVALVGLLLAPFVLLLPLALIDMGLFLVVVLPIGFATLLATGWRAVGRGLLVPGVVLGVLFYALFVKVLFPSVDRIKQADTHLAKASAFDAMGRVFGVQLPIIAGSMDRVAARALATRDPRLAEEILVSARPGPARDLLIPSIEQIWGARAYASAGPLGLGLGRAVVGGRGVAEPVSYAENAFSVFLLAEHGAFGGFMVLLLYLLLTLVAGSASMRAGPSTPASHRASRALFIVATLLIVIPAAYVALSNLGIVPITGQNMPFLGLNAWSDVTLVAGAIGILVTGTMRRAEEPV